MKAALLLALLSYPLAAAAQERAELVGQVGGRSVLMVLQSAPRPDGSARVTGEYIVFPTLVRRYVEGERSPELGITTLKESGSAILFGRDPLGELRGTWRAGAFRGTRYAAGGQERERFELSEDFPSMAQYSARVRCELGELASLSYEAEAGKLRAFEWRTPGCKLDGLEQRPFAGGLRLADGPCAVTLREVGEVVRIDAEHCTRRCASSLEPVVVDRRGGCRVLRPEAR